MIEVANAFADEDIEKKTNRSVLSQILSRISSIYVTSREAEFQYSICQGIESYKNEMR